MGRRSDERAGDAASADPSRPSSTGRDGDGNPSVKSDAPERDAAEAEIEAGDVADELADFA